MKRLLVLLVVVLAGCTTPWGTWAGLQNGGMLQWESDTQLGRDLDQMVNVGAHWLRLGINWDHVQSGGPTSWDWGNADRTINAALSRGLAVLAQAEQAPAWAREASCRSSLHCPPANPADYARFMGAAATRYAPQGIHAYEVWNEPNNPAFWVGGPDAASYTLLLNAAYDAIHQADPAATVVSGGLAPHGDLHANPTDPQAPINYEAAMYAHGARLDGLGWHPYPPLPNGPDACCINWNAFQQVPWAHDIMNSNGDGAKLVWGTEFGMATSPDSKGTTLQGQADGLVQGFSDWNGWRDRALVGPLFVYELRDNGTSTSWHDHLGLEMNDGTAKPAYDALRRSLS